MRVIVAGTRTITDAALVAKVIQESGFADLITQVIAGCSEEEAQAALHRRPPVKLNVDILGALWAIQQGLPVDYNPVTPQEWKTYGKFAGPRRNRVMGEKADGLILVWDGVSRGSASMLAIAEELGLRRYAPEVRSLAQPQLWTGAL